MSEQFSHSKPPSPEAPPDNRPNPADVPDELAEFRAEGEAFIARYREVFHTIAGDRSLDFRVGNGFWIDLKEGAVSLDVRDFQWARERGLSEDQILWSVCHELAHFRDLQEGPKEMLAHFEYLERRAEELVPEILAAWEAKLGTPLPSYLTAEVPFGSSGKRTVPYAFVFAYQKVHRFYNALDDMYVNGTIGLRSASFGEGGSREPEVGRLYRDYLFPTDANRRGEPPEGLRAVDYAQSPWSAQFSDVLLRKRMVPDQEVLIAPPVRERLDGFTDAAAKKFGITLRREVDSLTSVANAKARKPGWRYERIRESVEPVFLDCFRRDLRELPPPPPPKPSKGKGKGKGSGSGEAGPPGEPEPSDEPGKKPGEGGRPASGESRPGEPANPWGDDHDDKPEPIDLDAIREFIRQQEEKAKEDARKKAEEERRSRMTPDQRAKAAQSASDRRVVEAHDVDPKLAKEYRMLAESIRPYLRELATVFEEIMSGIAEQVRRAWVEGFQSGRFNVEQFIDKYGVDVATENIAGIPWESLDTYDQREFERRLVLFPEQMRVRLVIDCSGSMTAERILAAKQLVVLFLEALAAFEETMNLRFRLSEHITIDTEVWVFGNPNGAECVKAFAATQVRPEAEIANRFRMLGKINGSQGATCDAAPFWKIAETVATAEAERLRSGRAIEFALAVTDGGSNAVSPMGAEAVAHVPEREVIELPPEPKPVEVPEAPSASSESEEPPQPERITLHVRAMQDTRNAVATVEALGITPHAFQIGTPDRSERETFDRVWGEAGGRIPHPKDLAPTVARFLGDRMRKLRFQVQYLGADDAEE